jgi:hypothetical protein
VPLSWGRRNVTYTVRLKRSMHFRACAGALMACGLSFNSILVAAG